MQPRIRLLRSFDIRQHSYPGYVLTNTGKINGAEREFTIAIGKTAQSKHQFKVDDIVSGQSHPVLDSDTEIAEFYKTSRLVLIERQNS